MKNTDLSNSKLIASIIVLSFFFNAAFAQWSTDPTVNNPICTAPLDQLYPKIVSDGSGGAIITWDDNRNSNTDANIYAQRINSSGFVQWTIDGVTLCDTIRNQSTPSIAADGAGGAIIAWDDKRDVSLISDIFAQRIDASGVVLWTVNGIPICNNPEYQFKPVILSDGSGGAIIAWNDFREVGNINVYAQKINSSGVAQWPTNGVMVCNPAGEEEYLTLVSDGAGGAIITWQDSRIDNSDPDIYAQRINASGEVQWTDNGVLICDEYSSVFPTSTSDGAGGAIITWVDLRDGNSYHVYSQRINANGDVQWPANGVAICTVQYGGSHPGITSDDNGGAVITWEDIREGGDNFDIYTQKINASGIVQWTVNGVAICQAIGNQDMPAIISDSSSGAIITWRDTRTGGVFGDIYTQKINASGIVQWAVNGVAISTAAQDQNWPVLVSDGSAGAIITWGDKRDKFSTASDIYTQQLNANGELGIISDIAEESRSVIDFTLSQNYPNPAHKKTTILFEIKNSQMVSLKIYDVYGNAVSTLVNEKKSAGKHEVDFDLSEISPGVYFYVLQGSSLELTKKMIVR